MFLMYKEKIGLLLFGASQQLHLGTMKHLPLALQTRTFTDAQRKTDFVCCVTFFVLFCCPVRDDLRAVLFTKMSRLHGSGSFGWMSLQKLSCASGREPFFWLQISLI